MKLVIGGYAQGKLEYVLQKYKLEKNQVWIGELPRHKMKKIIVIAQFHLWIRTKMEKKEEIEEELLRFLEENPDTVIICDEVGNGIVPVDSFEREYRERVGRILTGLAGRAESVERVICGIGQKIK